jgi:hypothetical protein
MVFGHARFEQFTRNAVFSTIPLDPQLPVPDVDVYQATMDASNPRSPNQHQQIMIVSAILCPTENPYNVTGHAGAMD